MVRSLFLLIFTFVISNFLQAEHMTLKEKLTDAVPGSYLVTEQNKTYTFLHVYAKEGNTLILEEVSIPGSRFSKKSMLWKNWFESGAPGNTSWTMSQINLTTGHVEEIFSFTQKGWLDLTSSDCFMSTLLNLRFEEVPFEKRRRVGTPPGYGKSDYRPLWNPRLIVEGVVYNQVPFTAWKARWPSDRSELSRKIVEVYFPEASHANLTYPVYFPYWMEVDGKVGSAKIRVVDSGMGAYSPKPLLPQRSY